MKIYDSTVSTSLLRYDLAELYLKLKNYEKAEKVIKMAIQQDGSSKYKGIISIVPFV